MAMAMPLVDGAERSLKKVQEHIDNGMEDILTIVASLGGDQDMFDMDNVSALEEVMLDYASMERKLKHFTAAVKKVKGQLQETSGDGFDVEERLQAAYGELAADDSTQDLGRHVRVQQFNNTLQELQAACNDTEEEEEEAGPSSVADQSLGEEELVMTQTELGTKCPFTQTEMTNPVQNTICGHHYDSRSITALFKKGKKIKCPLPGCSNSKPIQKDHLEPDQEFKRRIDRQRKANRRRQADTMTQ